MPSAHMTESEFELQAYWTKALVHRVAFLTPLLLPPPPLPASAHPHWKRAFRSLKVYSTFIQKNTLIQTRKGEREKDAEAWGGRKG